jgi:hypothetical protein
VLHVRIAECFAYARGRASRLTLRAAIWLVLSAACSAASAADDDGVKQSCLEAHGEGQDEKEQGQVTRARSHFTMCAQPVCPVLVRDDCARLLNELERAQPSVGFAARDASGSDLPETSVFVDGMLVLSRLDGMWHEIDPGMHVVRFEHDGRRQEVSVIVGAGEKDRVIIGVFDKPDKPPPAQRAAPARTHRVGPIVAISASVALVVVGSALVATGLSRIPDNCSLPEHECAAPPGDDSFQDASHAVQLSNVGWGVGGVGLAGLAGSLLWYFKAPKGTEHATRKPTLTPFASTHRAGVSISARF